VLGVAPYVQGEAMLSHGGAVRGVAVRGVLPAREEQVSEIGRYLVEGSLDDLRDGAYAVLLGRGLARALGVSVGSRITVIAPQTTVSPAGIVPRMRRFTVAGIFEVNHYQYDTGIAVIHLSDAARLFRLDPGVTGLRIKVDDISQAPRVSHEIASALEGAFWVSDWTRYHRNFFRALETERTVMFVILSLIVAVAAFNIVSTLIMVVTDKQSDIAILRTLGATPRTVMRIFIVQGSVIGVIGTLVGVLGGVALALNVETLVPAIELFFETKFLSEEVYYIAEVPSELRRENVVVIAIVACVMSVLATLYPAWRASRVQPAEALRHE
jgi:lipoprotein-releasing system permease protein